MTSSITLNQREADEAQKAATSAAARFGDDVESSWVGFAGERAVIKYFNYEMGLSKSLKFNQDYSGGGDGGFDFSIDGVKFDAKTLPKSGAKSWHVRRTNADILVFSRYKRHDQRGHQFNIMGWMPTSRLKGPLVQEDDLLHMKQLAKALPDLFSGGFMPQSKPEKRLFKARELIRGVLVRVDK